MAETVECPTCTDRIPIEETWAFKELEQARGQHAKDVLLTAALETRLDQLRADLARVTEAFNEEERIAIETSTKLHQSRAEAARLRERVTSIARKWHTFGNRTARQFADEILQALTSDPEPTT
jgi:septal ring factor EnvC (AmiA/AmiB activator)